MEDVEVVFIGGKPLKHEMFEKAVVVFLNCSLNCEDIPLVSWIPRMAVVPTSGEDSDLNQIIKLAFPSSLCKRCGGTALVIATNPIVRSVWNRGYVFNGVAAVPTNNLKFLNAASFAGIPEATSIICSDLDAFQLADYAARFGTFDEWVDSTTNPKQREIMDRKALGAK